MMTFHSLRIATAALAAGCLLAWSASAGAQSIGTTVSGTVTVAGKQVPLPAGDFTVVDVALTTARVVKSGVETDRLDLGPIRKTTLAQIVDGRVGTVVEIAANLVPHHDGWGAPADCSRKDLYAAVSNYKSGWDVSCLYLKPLQAGGSELPGGQAVARFAREHGAVASDFWILAGLRVADRSDVVDVRYHVDPAALGMPATAGGADLWSPAAIEGQPARLAVVKDVAAWAAQAAAPLSLGLRGRLEPAAAGYPPIAGAAAVDPDGVERARRADALQQLRAAGAISESEFDRQMEGIAGPAAVAGAAGWTYAQVAGWKAFTYRVVVTTINAGIDYVFIGRPFAAGVLVILQVVVNTTKFFFHEMMWQEMFGISPLQRDTPNIVEFGRIVTASSN
jgi:uncharacterized membrane protein